MNGQLYVSVTLEDCTCAYCRCFLRACYTKLHVSMFENHYVLPLNAKDAHLERYIENNLRIPRGQKITVCSLGVKG